MKNEDPLEPLLTRHQAAEYLNTTYRVLCVWDSTKRYNLEPLKLGRAVRYRRSSLDKFIEQKDKIPFKKKEKSSTKTLLPKNPNNYLLPAKEDQ